MAFVEGARYFVDHKDFALKAIQKYTRLSDQDVLSKSYEYFAGELRWLCSRSLRF